MGSWQGGRLIIITGKHNVIEWKSVNKFTGTPKVTQPRNNYIVY